LVLQFPSRKLHQKETDALIEWVKRPQVGASGMVYVKCNEDGTYKSSVDKFYDQDDLSAWEDNRSKGRRYDFFYLALPIKQERN
jgi:aspartyl-tRNA synthetase